MTKTCSIGRIRERQRKPQEEAASRRKEEPQTCNSPTTPPAGRQACRPKDGFEVVRKAGSRGKHGRANGRRQKHTNNLELGFRLIGKAGEEACGPPRGGRGTYHIYHIFAFYLKGQSPSFFPLLALFTQPAISYMQKGLEGSELRLGEKAHSGSVLLGLAVRAGCLFTGPGPCPDASYQQPRLPLLAERKVEPGRAQGPGRLALCSLLHTPLQDPALLRGVHEAPCWSQSHLPGPRGFLGLRWVRFSSGPASSLSATVKLGGRGLKTDHVLDQ